MTLPKANMSVKKPLCLPSPSPLMWRMIEHTCRGERTVMSHMTDQHYCASIQRHGLPCFTVGTSHCSGIRRTGKVYQARCNLNLAGNGHPAKRTPPMSSTLAGCFRLSTADEATMLVARVSDAENWGHLVLFMLGSWFHTLTA